MGVQFTEKDLFWALKILSGWWRINMSCFADRGEPVKWEFTSSDATTAAPITLWDANSVARPLDPEERLFLLSYTASLEAGTTIVSLFDDKDGDSVVDPGERLAEFGNRSGFPVPISGAWNGEGQACGKGRIPKIKAAAVGEIAISGNGYIIKG